MTKRVVIIATLLAGIVGVGAIGPAMAQNQTTPDAAETQAMASATVTLAQASTAAEAKFGGKAIEISLDVIGGTPTYTVSLLATDGSESEALVDARTGTVVAASVDQVDQQGGDTEQNESGAETGEQNEG